MIFKLAFRNLRRNKRRTFLTIMIISVGIFCMVFGLSYMDGFYKGAIEEGTKVNGHLRISHPDYKIKSRSFDLSAFIQENILDNVSEKNGIKSINPRIQFGSLIFKGDMDRKTMVSGITDKDVDIYKLNLISGKGLNFGDEREILVGQDIANRLNIKIGDEITLMTSTVYSSVSAYNFKVSGVFSEGNNLYNKMCFISLSDAQYILDMEGNVSYICVYLKDLKTAETFKNELESKLENINIETWNSIGYMKLLNDHRYFIEFIFILIFGILTAVGILNTTMMIVFERKRETGILSAMGLNMRKITSLMLWEGLFMGVFGIILGFILGFSLVEYFSVNGIDFGKGTRNILDNYDLKNIIYPELSYKAVFLSVFNGLFFTLAGTFLPLISYYKKRPAELIKNR